MTTTWQQWLVENYKNKDNYNDNNYDYDDDNDLTTAVKAVPDFIDKEWDSMKRLREGNGADMGGTIEEEAV